MIEAYSWTVLATLGALLTYLFIGFSVSGARRRHGLLPPAMHGNETVERYLRAHGNTLEWLPLFLAPLWLFAFYFGDRLAAGVGLVWILGRILYAVGYARSPGARAPGFFIQALACAVLVGGAAWGAIRTLTAAGP